MYPWTYLLSILIRIDRLERLGLDVGVPQQVLGLRGIDGEGLVGTEGGGDVVEQLVPELAVRPQVVDRLVVAEAKQLAVDREDLGLVPLGLGECAFRHGGGRGLGGFK